MTYAGMGAPEPNFDWLLSHPSRLPNQTWATVFDRACYHEDDGHMCKVIRVLRHAENVSKPYDHLPEFKVKQGMFLPAAIAAIDSGSKQPMEWTKHFDFIRGAGYPEAWEKVPLRETRMQNGTGTANAVNGVNVHTESAATNGVNGANGHIETAATNGVNGANGHIENDVEEKVPQLGEKPVKLPGSSAEALPTQVRISATAG